MRSHNNYIHKVQLLNCYNASPPFILLCGVCAVCTNTVLLLNSSLLCDNINYCAETGALLPIYAIYTNGICIHVHSIMHMLMHNVLCCIAVHRAERNYMHSHSNIVECRFKEFEWRGCTGVVVFFLLFSLTTEEKYRRKKRRRRGEFLVKPIKLNCV